MSCIISNVGCSKTPEINCSSTHSDQKPSLSISPFSLLVRYVTGQRQNYISRMTYMDCAILTLVHLLE